MFRKERTQILKDNIKYLLRSRGETQLSLCKSSGVTRATIYNILEGRVTSVQHSTVRKISDFFGISYEEMETVDFEEKEEVDGTVSLLGNMNPAAVPIIKESLLIESFDKRIGELATIFPLTYYFGVGCNLIGVLLENDIEGFNEAGDLLIVKKGYSNSGKEKLAFNKSTRKFIVIDNSYFVDDFLSVVGEILEERFNG